MAKHYEKSYVKYFDEEQDAAEQCRYKNKISLHTVYCVVDGPEDNYAVVDLKTAIDLEVPYEIYYK